MNAIETVWPQSINLLCIFHVLQYVWKWLCDKEHNILKDDRKNLMTNFVIIVYCTREDEAENAFETAKVLGEKYDKWVQYLEQQWAIKEKWCFAYRHHITKGDNTNNYAEATIRIFKDLVLERCKTFNLVSLVDAVVVTMDEVITFYHFFFA